MIKRKHCWGYGQWSGLQSADVWLWVAFLCLPHVYQQMFGPLFHTIEYSWTEAGVTAINHLPAMQVEGSYFHWSSSGEQKLLGPNPGYISLKLCKYHSKKKRNWVVVGGWGTVAPNAILRPGPDWRYLKFKLHVTPRDQCSNPSPNFIVLSLNTAGRKVGTVNWKHGNGTEALLKTARLKHTASQFV